MSGRVWEPGCGPSVVEIFLTGTEPRERCGGFYQGTYVLEGYEEPMMLTEEQAAQLLSEEMDHSQVIIDPDALEMSEDSDVLSEESEELIAEMERQQRELEINRLELERQRRGGRVLPPTDRVPAIPQRAEPQPVIPEPVNSEPEEDTSPPLPQPPPLPPPPPPPPSPAERDSLSAV